MIDENVKARRKVRRTRRATPTLVTLERRRLLSGDPAAYLYQPEMAAQQQSMQLTQPGAVRQDSSLHANTLPPTDDGFFGSIQLGFPINLAGDVFQTAFINANGSVSFGGQYATPLIVNLPQSTISNFRVLAPFFSDVDTRDGGGTITYGSGTIEGRSAFAVSWNDVGAYKKNQAARNTFQLVIIDRSDVHPGAFALEYNYDKLEWDTAAYTQDPANNYKYYGQPGVHGPASAVFQISSGNGLAVNSSWKAAGSMVAGALLDSNPDTGLVNSSLNSDVAGRYTWLIAGEFVGVGRAFEIQTNQSYSGLVGGFFDTANLIGRATAYAASIDWGDGVVSPATLTQGTDILYKQNLWGQSASYRVQGNHAYLQSGEYVVTTTITLPGGATHQIPSRASVLDTPLALIKPSAQSNYMGDQASLQVQASGTNLTYSANRLPPGLTMDPATGLISGTILGSAGATTYSVQVSVSDGRSTLFESFGWTVGASASGPVVTVHAALGGLEDTTGLGNASYYPTDVPASFTLLRDSYISTQPSVTVYFQLLGTAVYGVDYTLSFGGRDVGLMYASTLPGSGYVDESTGQGYVTFQPGYRFAMLFIDSLYSGSAAKTVGVEILGQGNQFGGVLGYQMPPQSAGAAVQPLPTITANHTVSGTAQFASSAPNSGPAKPVRQALVRVYQTDNLGLTTIVGESYTAIDGSFVVAIRQLSSQAAALTLRVYTYSETLYAKTRVDVRSYAQTHYKDFPISNWPSSSSPNGSAGVVAIDDTSTSGKAFWVYDSVVTGVGFANSMGPIPFFPASTTVDFPAPWVATTSYAILGVPHIREADYDAEDSILHEFGHVYAQHANFFPLDIVVKRYLSHSAGSDHREQYSWSEELPKLSFSEGWANFFSVASRFAPGSTIPTFHGYDPEFNDPQASETDEVAIMRLLWDLSDPVAAPSTHPNPLWTDESQDRVELQYQGETGFRAVFKLVKARDIRTVAGLRAALDAADPTKTDDYARLFALHGVGVNSVEMTDGSVVKTTWSAADAPPTFRWRIPVGRFGVAQAGTQVFNTFSVAIYDANNVVTNLLHLGNAVDAASGQFSVINDVAYWTPSPSLWKAMTLSPGAKRFQVWASEVQIAYYPYGYGVPGYYAYKIPSGVYRSPMLDFVVVP